MHLGYVQTDAMVDSAGSSLEFGAYCCKSLEGEGREIISCDLELGLSFCPWHYGEGEKVRSTAHRYPPFETKGEKLN
jgi:hypothetical protein